MIASRKMKMGNVFKLTNFLTSKSNFMKDKIIVYKNQQVKFNGNFVKFDGKGNPDNKTLKVYKYYGDITISIGALKQFCIERGYETLLTQF